MEQDRILIIDENGFGRVCSAILAAEGFSTEAVESGAPLREAGGRGLVIVSYPYVSERLEEVRGLGVPVIVLTDHISRELLSLLERLERSYCLMKPLNFDKFVLLVKQLMSGEMTCQGGYRIV